VATTAWEVVENLTWHYKIASNRLVYSAPDIS
jgi:hypothetical protein